MVQTADITGYFNGKPTFAREQFAESMAQAAAASAARAASAQSKAEADALKQQSAQATSAAIAEAMTYPNYDTAMGALQYHAPAMADAGVDVRDVLDAIVKKFGTPDKNKDPLYIE
jgi:hypothetical protein